MHQPAKSRFALRCINSVVRLQSGDVDPDRFRKEECTPMGDHGRKISFRVIERIIEAVVWGGILLYANLRWPEVYMKSWFAVLIAAILALLVATATADRERGAFMLAHPQLQPKLQLALVGITWLATVIATPWNDPLRYPLQWVFCIAITIGLRAGLVWMWRQFLM